MNELKDEMQKTAKEDGKNTHSKPVTKNFVSKQNRWNIKQKQHKHHWSPRRAARNLYKVAIVIDVIAEK